MKSAGNSQLATPTGGAGSARSAVVQTLRRQIRQLETVGRRDECRLVSTGCRELDALLPEGGLVAGTITEWLTPASGQGAMILSLLAARSACAGGGALVVIDADRSFYPPAAVAWGIDLDHVVVLRPPPGDRRALYWAIDQSLRSPAVAAVWGPVDRVDQRWQRRFQLSAESSGAVGLLVRPTSVLGDPGWADVQWLVGRALAPGRRGKVAEVAQTCGHPTSSSFSFARFVSLRLVRVRGGDAWTQPQMTLQIDFTTGAVRKVEYANEQRSGNRPEFRSIPDCGVSRPPTQQQDNHSGHLAALLARPATGRRQRRA